MANVSFVVSYWKQSTGLTGQNLSERNQFKFSRVAKKYHKKTGTHLSKVKLYKASRHAARQLKAEYGGRILSHSIACFELILTAVDKELSKRPHNLDMGSFDVSNIKDLCCASRGRKASKQAA
tara:strand:+ start:279 stop:647 length:369 start_codon:yes stop_codon:yes gene_type:complete